MHLQLSLVNRSVLLIFSALFFIKIVAAQNEADSTVISENDSLSHYDTTNLTGFLPTLKPDDSISKRPLKNASWQLSSSASFSDKNLIQNILQRHPFFGFWVEPLNIRSDIRQFDGKELFFYVLIFLFLVYAILRQAFPKYFNDLFRLFFRTTMKQRQIREQLIQTPLPSFMLNGFFVVNGALYISFILQHFKLNPFGNFWVMFFYSCLGLSIIYLVKFLGLKISGWVFNMQEAANSYIFIVFINNKMLGLLLLPFLVLLAFAQGNIYSAALTLSWCVVAGLLAYRLILTYAAVRNQVKVNPFHFFLYFCGFEIAPLLLIYKGLLLFFHITA